MSANQNPTFENIQDSKNQIYSKENENQDDNRKVEIIGNDDAIVDQAKLNNLEVAPTTVYAMTIGGQNNAFEFDDDIDDANKDFSYLQLLPFVIPLLGFSYLVYMYNKI